MTTKDKFAKLQVRMDELSAKQTLTAEESAEFAKVEAEMRSLVLAMQGEAAQAQIDAAKRSAKPEGYSVQKQIREAIANNKKSFTINAERREAATITTGSAAGVIDTEIQSILEPLYANSVLAKLGVKWFTGMPMGNISIPVMGKGNVGWADEIAAAAKSDNAFTNIELTPKRLTAFVDISNMLLAQDSHDAEAAIRRDIVNALNDKLEATILGSAAGSTTQPAGIFNGKTLADGSDFAKICKIEAGVEENNVYGNMKYLLSTGAKADLRAMAKSSKNTQLVYEGGEVDGVPAITTSNVKTAGAYVYGDFSNLAIASWGNIDVKVDDLTQAVNGCTRLVINAYFDAKVLRDEAFAYGKTRVTA